MLTAAEPKHLTSMPLLVNDYLSPAGKAGCDRQVLPYEPVWQRMREFTSQRARAAVDELWLLEHHAVYTLGQAGDPQHILDAGEIPVVKVDRGGQVTYHGPGQIMLYLLADLARLGVGVRAVVDALERCVVNVLATYGIAAQADARAPGVYVDGKKIAALGLRVRRGCSYHGLCFNYAFDATPFQRINPCGYAGMQVTQLRDLLPALPGQSVLARLLACELAQQLGYNRITFVAGNPAALIQASDVRPVVR